MIEESQAIEAYIGTPKTVDFYKEGFHKYSAAGVDQFAWHWSWWAMFGGVFYLLYRKLYIEALIYFLIFAFVGMIPLVGLILWVVSGGVLPYLVYKRYKKMKAQIENNIQEESAQLEALHTVGGVNKWAIWLGVGIHVVMWIISIYMALMISAVQKGV